MTTQVPPSPISDSTSNNDYLVELLNQCQSLNVEGLDTDMAAHLRSLRQSNAAWLRQSKFPTTQEEEWRFTDLSSLPSATFNSVKTEDFLSLQENTELLKLPECQASRLVFVNGVYAPNLSAVSGLPDGVVVSNLAGLPTANAQRVWQYLAQSPGSEEVFTAVNTAGIQDVAVVWVEKNVAVKTPIHLVFLATGGVSLPRCLVVAQSGSQVTLVEEFMNRLAYGTASKDALAVSLPLGKDVKKEEEEVYFTDAVTEIYVEDNAQVSHTRIEKESKSAFHVGKSTVSQGRYSRYSCNAVCFGSRLSRHNLEIFQTGEQTETILNGLTMIGGNQLADTHSVLALNYPYGISRQLHKCIVSDRARSVFNGKIFVPKAAQLTDASQLNRNLLLSSKARVDTKPQLEITADNVKCAHGATVSQLEDDEIFYLQSRGIDEDDAHHLLINAFATEIIKQIPVPSLRERLIEIAKKF